MINTNLLHTKDELNAFTTHLADLINKSDDNIGFMVKTRNGKVFHTTNMVVDKNQADNCYFKSKDCQFHWNADGSCYWKADGYTISNYDLISCEN